MTEEKYNKLLSVIRASESRKFFVIWIDKLITLSTIIAYVAVLWYYWGNDKTSFIDALLVPLISFIGVSIFRHFYHGKRPYEVFDIEPLIDKKTVENSFPSRHVFSIFIIAMTLLFFNITLGCMFLLLGCVLGIVRVFEGVHFPADVLAGAVIGILCGLTYLLI